METHSASPTTSNPPHQPQSPAEVAIRALYEQTLEGWNSRSGEAFAANFAEDGEAIGFDGSQRRGRAAIASDLQRIFDDHPTASYVRKVRSIRLLTPKAGILQAVVGMVPPGQSDIAPQVNAIQSIVAIKQSGGWRIVLLQTTPAQYHGQPELAQALTEELQQVLERRQ